LSREGGLEEKNNGRPTIYVRKCFFSLLTKHVVPARRCPITHCSERRQF